MKTKSVSAAAFLVLASALAVDAAWAGSHEVKIQGFQFQPAKLQVAVGDTITWTNADGMPHTVTSKAAGVESDAIAPGGKWTYTVKSKGDVDYACRFHPSMKGAVSAK